MSISLCLIVKNEEKRLKDFLEHHKQIADEIIIVDTGSVDNSIRIAKLFTPRVFIYRWNDDFSKARNFSIGKASNEWILWLDPDERIDREYFTEIRELCKKSCCLGYSLVQKTYSNITIHPRFVRMGYKIYEGQEWYEGYYIRRICKLFRNNLGIRFIYPVHETVASSIKEMRGRIEKTNIIIEHFPNENINKSEYYIKLIEKKRKSFPKSNADKEMMTEHLIRKSLSLKSRVNPT